MLRQGLALTTRAPQHESYARPLLDQALINRRYIAETIIGHIKEFSSLRLSKYCSAFSAFTHLTAAIIAYQIEPLLPKPVCAFMPSPSPLLD